ncbi:hypothetical protein [Microvirga tunisiensis]|uniref:Uncharacterized protein n=1 Tax=Microvirga tunisiensis TaxID=2108360 RepID=A0A5N7MAW4_9HYPH|nr:hypothetical protein [Microvirga tunisiensis]MPR05618.1 hypothetical protein [Microvirga tunisiensis]MPR23818.1 hypothetical protein [Microvirga tunisiensis]
MQVIVIDANSRQIACQDVQSEDDLVGLLSEPDFDRIPVYDNVVALVGEHSLFVPGQRFIEIFKPESLNSSGTLRGTAVLACLGRDGNLSSIEDTALKASGWLAHLQATTKFLRPFRTGFPNRPIALTDDAGDHIVHCPALQVATLTQKDFTNGPL